MSFLSGFSFIQGGISVIFLRMIKRRLHAEKNIEFADELSFDFRVKIDPPCGNAVFTAQKEAVFGNEPADE